MTEQKSPSRLLVLYILAEHPDTPLTDGELQTELEHRTGHRMSDRTLRDAVNALRDEGLIQLVCLKPRTYRITPEEYRRARCDR